MAISVPANLEGFDAIDDWLTSFEAEVQVACFQALYESIEDVQQSARDTDSYEDDTTATRNSTFAYVFDSNDEGSVPDEHFEAVEIANSYRPYSASEDSPPSLEELPPNSMGIDVFSATDYSHFLNIRNAMAGAYLELAIVDNTTHIMTRIAANVKEVMF